ncbi:MAG: hypothetical protein R3F53_08755 [Gammaproteobacteria bacterium]
MSRYQPERDSRCGVQGRVLHSRSVWRDITERKQAERKIQRLNRMYAMLSGINALIVRVRDQQELLMMPAAWR